MCLLKWQGYDPDPLTSEIDSMSTNHTGYSVLIMGPTNNK